MAEQSAQAGEPAVVAASAGYRIVRPGDTLYSIAWEAGLDYRRVAQWNAIAEPYVIRPGQRIELKAPARPGGVPAPAAKDPAPAATDPGADEASGPVDRWVWPAKGKLSKRFSTKKGSKGIDIAGRLGSAVRAAAAGKVVYAGSGLRGYGQLIIVKHNDTYLSAYALNRKILVREGARVGAGDPIAEMGDGGGGQGTLHFEIRRRGSPVDPLRYLPRT